MRYKLLGKSGLRVSELCLGTMTFGEDWGWGADKATSLQMAETFAEAGGNFIDTAVNYTVGTSEEYVGEVISADRDYWVVATKYTLTDEQQTDPNRGGNSRKNMVQSVERSLKRLGTDYIDLLYLHMWDFMTPVEEVMRALDDLVRAGKVLYVGFSDTPAWIVAEANARAEMHGWARPVAYQAPYSLKGRDVERAEVPMARYWDMAFLAWGILSSGLLTGKYKAEADGSRRMGDRPMKEDEIALLEAVEAVADEVDATPAQVAVNWVRAQNRRAVMIPILGATKVNQLEDNLAALDWELSDEQVERLNEASPIRYGFPRDFLEQGTRDIVFGQTFDQIDNHRGNPVR